MAAGHILIKHKAHSSTWTTWGEKGLNRVNNSSNVCWRIKSQRLKVKCEHSSEADSNKKFFLLICTVLLLDPFACFLESITFYVVFQLWIMNHFQIKLSKAEWNCGKGSVIGWISYNMVTPLLSCQSGMGALVVLGQACFSATRRWLNESGKFFMLVDMFLELLPGSFCGVWSMHAMLFHHVDFLTFFLTLTKHIGKSADSVR